MLKRFLCMQCEVMPFYAVRVGKKPGIYETWLVAKLFLNFNCINMSGSYADNVFITTLKKNVFNLILK